MAEMLNNEKAKPFHHDFHNQHTVLPRESDVTRFSGLSSTAITNNLNAIIQANGVTLSEEQKAAIRSVQSLQGLFAITEGYPGAAKSEVLPITAVWLVSMGIHVALSTPSHAATDNFVMKVGRVLSRSRDPKLRVLKSVIVYRQMNEDIKFFKSDQQDSEQIDEIEADFLLSSVLDKLKQSRRQKTLKLIEYSLQNQVLQRAKDAVDEGVTLMKAYETKDKDASSKPLEVDMYAEVLQYRRLLSTSEVPFHKWEVSEKEK